MARRKGTSDRAGAFFETTTPMSRKEQLIRQYAIRYSLEFVVIFLGVVVSFNVQRMSEEKSEAQEARRLIYTLTTEIEANLDYCQEHLKQLLIDSYRPIINLLESILLRVKVPPQQTPVKAAMLQATLDGIWIHYDAGLISKDIISQMTKDIVTSVLTDAIEK